MDSAQARAIAAGLVTAEPAAAFASGISLIKADRPEELLSPALELTERHSADPRFAQLLGLAARATGNGPLAWRAFARAATLVPGDPLIAHSYARTMLEAGKPAAALFEQAARLAPGDGTVLTGLAAALVAEGRAGEAVERLDALLEANPLWLDGHRSRAQISVQTGGNPVQSIEAALAALPRRPELHNLRITTLLEAHRAADAAVAAAEAATALGPADWLDVLAGHALSEAGELAAADRRFAAAAHLIAPEQLSLRARHALRANRPEEVVTLLSPDEASAHSGLYWPYLSLAWRILGDSRADWLEGDDRLVGVYDLAEQLPDLDKLAEHLRQRHFASRPPLDQSVRGGTQTDGNLLLRDEAPLIALRKILQDAVQRHLATLPPPAPHHPTLIERRRPWRIAGSWSVRLRGAGFHADHIHDKGWLSSAFYVALPLGSEDSHAGWLTLGECRELVPGLQPRRLVEPKPGRLVLFPSTMWHGTRPFPSGERITVAFDIAIPSQS